ncbi:MAG: zinc ribbon domain-containing protein [Anaerolineales bacterium]|nr:zinc ribbon domain-containing protein [Anaerolineales bacterium]
MPIYEFVCPSCSAEFEELVRRSTDAADVACPRCGQPHATKQLSRIRINGLATTSGYTEAPAASGSSGCCGGACSLE